MKASKLLAMLALAGACGTAEAETRSHRFEIERLEKQRTEQVEVHREAQERLSELNPRVHSSATVPAETEDDIANLSENQAIPVHGNWDIAEKELRNFNWDTRNPDLIRAREAEEARMRKAAREIAKIDKAIRKEKARERRT